MSPEREEEIRELFEDSNDARCVVEAALVRTLGELLAEIDCLRKSIREYAGHYSNCLVSQWMYGPTKIKVKPDCTCGFDEAYKKAIRNDARTEDHCNSTEKPRGLRGGT